MWPGWCRQNADQRGEVIQNQSFEDLWRCASRSQRDLAAVRTHAVLADGDHGRVSRLRPSRPGAPAGAPSPLVAPPGARGDSLLCAVCSLADGHPRRNTPYAPVATRHFLEAALVTPFTVKRRDDGSKGGLNMDTAPPADAGAGAVRPDYATLIAFPRWRCLALGSTSCDRGYRLSRDFRPIFRSQPVSNPRLFPSSR